MKERDECRVYARRASRFCFLLKNGFFYVKE